MMMKQTIARAALYFLLTVQPGPAMNSGAATFTVGHLTTEYMSTPLGIDVRNPRFGWQMSSTSNERGVAQSAYQIVVSDTKDIVWDSSRVATNHAVGIVYGGSPLAPSTRYTWTVKVWDQGGTIGTASSWFETGLLNSDPGLAAWEGASWIGGGYEDLVFYSPYFCIFDLKYSLSIAPGSTRAAFVLGANDSRLMDRNKNTFQVENGPNQSYIKVELDISPLENGNSDKAKLNVYRAGYTDKDNAAQPFAIFEIPSSTIDKDNKNKEHAFAIRGEFGRLTISIDGSSPNQVGGWGAAAGGGGRRGGFPGGPGGPPGGFGGNRENRGGPPGGGGPPPGLFGTSVPGASVNLNPMGQGHDYIPFGMLCDIGFAMEPGQSARFSDLEISNTRSPNHRVFFEDLSQPTYRGIYRQFASDPNSGFAIRESTYQVAGGANGAFVVADPSRNSMPMLRTRFSAAAKRITAARLYVTARGIYEVYLNGNRVGDDRYNPGLTQYNKTHLYQTYDVTSLIIQGQNALGALLGEGWWSGQLSFGSVWNHFGDRQSLLAKLAITYEDGSRQVITTNDKEWKYYGSGPIVYSSLNMGEVYDAPREAQVRNWATAAYDDNSWKGARTVQLQGTTYSNRDFDFNRLNLIGQIGNSAGVFQTRTAAKMSEVRKGVYVYDMGQNLVGVPRIAIRNGKTGRKLTVRLSEMLYPNLPEYSRNVGMVMTENYRAALSQDIYIMKDGEQVFEPRFTSHGFQYLEITGLEEPLPLDAVQALAISSIRELTANYETSNSKVNRLWQNIVWSAVDNFLTIPTDCPQRNERMGWSGDINVFSRTATYISNASQFLRRHLLAMRDVQTTQGKFTDIAPVGGGFGGLLWGSAGITIPWESYQQYGDVAVLREHYPAMAAYIAYLDGTIDPKTRLCRDAQLGDWLGPQNNQLGADFLVTAYHIFDLDIMVKVARVLNKKEEAEKFEQMRDERKAFFNKTFVNADRKTMAVARARGGFGGPPGGGGPGGESPAPEFRLADTQSSYAVGLALDAFDAENIPFMVNNLRAAVARENQDDGNVLRPRYSLMTGFIGTAWINKALSDHGSSDLAYRLLQNTQYPSWLYPVEQGATTIWERLNGYTVDNGFGGNNSMNSFNHYSFGAVGQWLMADSLGVQREEPGFKKFVLQPQPDPTGQMTWAKGFYDSPYGRIASSWKVQNGILTYSATVPGSTSATLFLPTQSPDTVTENGQPALQSPGVKLLRKTERGVAFTLVSGSYVFVSRL